MRRAFVAEERAAAGVAFARGLAARQHVDPGLQAGDLGLLAGDDLGQFVDRAGKMGDMFFQRAHAGHVTAGHGGGQSRRVASRAMPQLAPVPPLG